MASANEKFLSDRFAKMKRKNRPVILVGPRPVRFSSDGDFPLKERVVEINNSRCAAAPTHVP
jgi:hypothetical protein